MNYFTLKYNGRTPVLITDCKVACAANPNLVRDPNALIWTDAKAIWDTGATNCAISEDLVKKIGCHPTGFTTVLTADGPKKKMTYALSLGLPNGIAIPFVKATEAKLEGADMLIGMDIIGFGDFAITNKDGETWFSFRTPSVSHTDYGAQSNAQNGKNKNGGKNKGGRRK